MELLELARWRAAAVNRLKDGLQGRRKRSVEHGIDIRGKQDGWTARGGGPHRRVGQTLDTRRIVAVGLIRQMRYAMRQRAQLREEKENNQQQMAHRYTRGVKPSASDMR